MGAAIAMTLHEQADTIFRRNGSHTIIEGYRDVTGFPVPDGLAIFTGIQDYLAAVEIHVAADIQCTEPDGIVVLVNTGRSVYPESMMTVIDYQSSAPVDCRCGAPGIDSGGLLTQNGLGNTAVQMNHAIVASGHGGREAIYIQNRTVLVELGILLNTQSIGAGNAHGTAVQVHSATNGNRIGGICGCTVIHGNRTVMEREFRILPGFQISLVGILICNHRQLTIVDLQLCTAHDSDLGVGNVHLAAVQLEVTVPAHIQAIGITAVAHKFQSCAITKGCTAVIQAQASAVIGRNDLDHGCLAGDIQPTVGLNAAEPGVNCILFAGSICRHIGRIGQNGQLAAADGCLGIAVEVEAVIAMAALFIGEAQSLNGHSTAGLNIGTLAAVDIVAIIVFAQTQGGGIQRCVVLNPELTEPVNAPVTFHLAIAIVSCTFRNCGVQSSVVLDGDAVVAACPDVHQPGIV